MYLLVNTEIGSGETRLEYFVIRAVRVSFLVPMLFAGKETTAHTFSTFSQQEPLEAIAFQIKAGLW